MTKQPETVKDTISRSIGEAKEAPEEGKQIAQPQSQAKREKGEMVMLDQKTLQNLVQDLAEWVEELCGLVVDLSKSHQRLTSAISDSETKHAALPRTSAAGQHLSPNSHNGLQETMAQLLEHLTAPKEVVRDMNGRLVGIRHNKAFAAAPNGHLKDAANEETPNP